MDAVADLNGILQQQKQPGDEVPHQLREPKPMAMPTIPAPASSGDVDADFAQRRQADDSDDQAQQRRAHRLKVITRAARA